MKKRPAKTPRHGGRRKGAGRPKGAKTRPRTVATYQELGDAPLDEFEAMKWAFRSAAVALREIQVAPMAAEKRWGQMRTQIRTMNAVFPKARLAEAVRAMKGEDDQIQSKVDPATEPAPAAAPRRSKSKPAPAPAPAARAPQVEAVPPRPPVRDAGE